MNGKISNDFNCSSVRSFDNSGQALRLSKDERRVLKQNHNLDILAA